MDLLTFLKDQEYGLALSPGFFRFYALMGVLHEFEISECLKPSHIAGSSAGALVGGFYAAGMNPSEMLEPVFSIKRSDIWDVGGIGGLLKGQLFQDLLNRFLPVQNFTECRIPLGVTAYNLFGFRTSMITEGSIATAIRASCTFPGLFQPVMINNFPHIDGGVFDHAGLMALPGIPPSKLIVNIVCDHARLVVSNLTKTSHGNHPDSKVYNNSIN